jgi:hypothetical protein
MALTTNPGQKKVDKGVSLEGMPFFVGENQIDYNKYPEVLRDKKIAASVVVNPDNDKECFLITPKDFIKDATFQDYYSLGFTPVKRY